MLMSFILFFFILNLSKTKTKIKINNKIEKIKKNYIFFPFVNIFFII